MQFYEETFFCKSLRPLLVIVVIRSAYRKADSVMLCILPVNDTNDVTLQIHSTLIEAFCWENDINLVKVCIFFSL